MIMFHMEILLCSSATIELASGTVFAEGKKVTRKGDSASCGQI